ncbi:MAG TPA: integration host factor subunit beta [Porphyromonadaceae bacterium]|nr:integration host factor subunit beta [Porphyromonadaceae bacterium]
MTKADIVNEISRRTGLEKAAVLTTVENFMQIVKENMTEGENVYLRGFGSFILKTRKKKTARNISKNISIEIPEHQIPAFKPSKVFLEAVKDAEVK